jgi:hypothetical protein
VSSKLSPPAPASGEPDDVATPPAEAAASATAAAVAAAAAAAALESEPEGYSRSRGGGALACHSHAPHSGGGARGERAMPLEAWRDSEAPGAEGEGSREGAGF